MSLATALLLILASALIVGAWLWGYARGAAHATHDILRDLNRRGMR